MCLYVKGPRISRIAKEDIPIFKELVKTYDYRRFPEVDSYFTTSVVYFRVPSSGILTPTENPTYIFPKMISGGYIHCRLNLSYGALYEEETIGKEEHKFIFVKGYIPKGTRYYIGDSDDICAKKVILTLPKIV